MTFDGYDVVEAGGFGEALGSDVQQVLWSWQ